MKLRINEIWLIKDHTGWTVVYRLQLQVLMVYTDLQVCFPKGLLDSNEDTEGLGLASVADFWGCHCLGRDL